jgi:hypothetical protein
VAYQAYFSAGEWDMSAASAEPLFSLNTDQRKSQLRLPLDELDLFTKESDTNSTIVPRIETRAVDELKPHPALVKTGLFPSPARLAELEVLGERIFRDPLVVTHEGFIVDGHARWSIAQQRGQKAVVCAVYMLSRGQALVRILDADRGRHGFIPYRRVELALLLEPGLRKRAEAKRHDAGASPSNLTRSKQIDCRPEIAHLARVSTGNVTKVRAIRERGIPSLVEELRAGRMSIHAGWKLARMSPAEQQSHLGWRRTRARRARRLDKLIALAESGQRSFAAPLRKIWIALRELKTYERLLKLAVRIDELLLAIEYELETDEETTETEHS